MAADTDEAVVVAAVNLGTKRELARLSPDDFVRMLDARVATFRAEAYRLRREAQATVHGTVPPRAD